MSRLTSRREVSAQKCVIIITVIKLQESLIYLIFKGVYINWGYFLRVCYDEEKAIILRCGFIRQDWVLLYLK